jgi:hypothetical protein
MTGKSVLSFFFVNANLNFEVGLKNKFYYHFTKKKLNKMNNQILVRLAVENNEELVAEVLKAIIGLPALAQLFAPMEHGEERYIEAIDRSLVSVLRKVLSLHFHEPVVQPYTRIELMSVIDGPPSIIIIDRFRFYFDESFDKESILSLTNKCLEKGHRLVICNFEYGKSIEYSDLLTPMIDQACHVVGSGFNNFQSVRNILLDMIDDD